MYGFVVKKKIKQEKNNIYIYKNIKNKIKTDTQKQKYEKNSKHTQNNIYVCVFSYDEQMEYCRYLLLFIYLKINKTK